MKSSKNALPHLVVLTVIFSFGISDVSAGWDSNFDLARSITGFSESSAEFASDVIRTSQGKPKRRNNKNRNRGTVYKKPNYKIKAPQKSAADRAKEDGALLDYLDGKGLSDQTPLARKPTPGKGAKKPDGKSPKKPLKK